MRHVFLNSSCVVVPVFALFKKRLVGIQDKLLSDKVKCTVDDFGLTVPPSTIEPGHNRRVDVANICEELLCFSLVSLWYTGSLCVVIEVEQCVCDSTPLPKDIQASLKTKL